MFHRPFIANDTARQYISYVSPVQVPTIDNTFATSTAITAASNGKTKILKLLHDEVCRTTQGQDMKTFL